MNNPTILSQIEKKLTISSLSNYLGEGINTFKVNRTQQTSDILTCNGASFLGTGGCYITETVGTTYTLGGFPALTATRVSLYEVVGNNAACIFVVRIIGVSATNEEQEELVSINGTTPVNTVLTYKCVNDMIHVSGNMMFSGRTVTCRPLPSGSPGPSTQHLVRLQIGGDTKLNPMFMCSNKNGRQRKARLVAIDGTLFQGVNTNLLMHVFTNNGMGGTNLGTFNLKLKMYDLPINSVAQTAVFFGDDSVVELSAGEYALFFKDAVTTTTALTWHWELYYVD